MRERHIYGELYDILCRACFYNRLPLEGTKLVWTAALATRRFLCDQRDGFY